MATFPYAGFLDGTAYPAIGTGSTVVNVASSSALTTALNNAVAGQRIVLANGTYSGAFTLSGKAGTSTAPISIEAGTTGGAVFASGSTFSLTGACTYIALKGLSFPFELGSGNVVQFRGTSHHCRVTRCTFGPTTIASTPTATKATFVFGSDSVEFIRVDHNEFRNKTNPGNAILFDGNFTTLQACRHIRIDHNLIQSIKPEASNEKEPIRLGVSTMSKTFSYSVIERNVFFDCIAEPEVISVKAGGVRVSGNTIDRCIGGPVYRHGTDGVMSDNYVIDRATGGGGGGGGGGTPSGVTSTVINNVVMLTQAQYDALSTKDVRTLYCTNFNSISSATVDAITAGSITKVAVLTSSGYSALTPKDPNTLYITTGQVASTVAAATITSATVDTVVQLTQAQYNALSSLSPRTMYIISG